MPKYISAAFCLFAFVAINGVLVSAQVPFPGACPNVTIPDQFDLDAYLGVWYEHSKYPFAFEIGKKCIYARYGQGENNTVSVLNASINRLTGNPSNVTGSARVIAPGQLAVSFSPNQKPNRANYIVLGTDYQNYSVVYSCTSLSSVANFKVVWILTRERKPSQATVDKALEVIDANQLNKSFLITTNQEECPEISANGTFAGPAETPVRNFISKDVPRAVETA